MVWFQIMYRYCRMCGAEHAEWIPFEGMWLCESCYYDLKY